MAREANNMTLPPIIAAYQQWITNCLVADGSLFSSSKLWTPELVEEVRAAFVDHPDMGGDSFWEKLKKQMQNASPAAKQLMAEMIWAMLTFTSNINADTKRNGIREVWAYSGKVLSDTLPLLSDEVLVGIGSGGQGYLTGYWRELTFIIKLTVDLKTKSLSERQKILTSYDDFAAWIAKLPEGDTRQFRHMLRYVAFPDHVERIASNKHRQDILDRFGIATEKETKNWSDRQLDDALFNLRTQLQKDYPGQILDFYEPPLKAKWRPDEETPTPPVALNETVTQEFQYWAGGSTWGDESKSDEFINGNFWEIGWEKDSPEAAAKKTWKNYEDVKVGDEFAIKGYGGRNNLRIYYVGKVTAKSDDGRLELQKLDRPLFRDQGPHGLTSTTWFDTLVPIKNKAIIKTIFHGGKKGGPDTSPVPEPNSPISAASNTILYGPPGTGKTYKTIERAVQIIEPGFTGDHAALKSRFDALRAKGQIEFITFHQSYSYEDFVEGLRPVIEGPESSEAAYEYSSGVFKRFAFRALFDCLKPAAGIVSFDAVWKKLVEQTELEPDKLYPGLSEKTSYRISLSTKGNLEGINTISNKTFLCSRSILEKVFVALPENDSVTSSEVLEVVVRGCHSHFVAAMFNELKRIENSEFSGKHPTSNATISPEQKEGVAQAFLEKTNPGADAFKPADQWPHYVLVIDEINRGNISKILGELITLIEPDKRLGAENSLVVTLPYTRHRFAVPGNLHVLGTMNTADKSIALVDVALRRRFQFEELRANFAHCQQLTQPMREVLETLNRRICLRKDRDHQIGHSYFIKVSDAAGFNRVFARHVVPLLQEYFYNDWDGLRFVLGVKNQPDKLIIPLKDGDSGDSRSSWQWSFEAGNNSVNDMDFLQMLGGNGPAT